MPSSNTPKTLVPKTRLEVWTFLIRKNPQARRFGDHQHAWGLRQLSSSLWTGSCLLLWVVRPSAAAIRSSRHIICLRGDASEAERAADPLHRTGIDTKSLGNLAPGETWRRRGRSSLRRSSIGRLSASPFGSEHRCWSSGRRTRAINQTTQHWVPA